MDKALSLIAISGLYFPAGNYFFFEKQRFTNSQGDNNLFELLIIVMLPFNKKYMKFPMLFISLLTGLFMCAQSPSLSVIANPKGAPAEMTQARLKSIFLGEIQIWENGSKIMLGLMKSNTEPGKLTADKVYQKSGDEVKKFWLSKVFEGKAEAPLFFNTVSELQTFVTATPGALGIIDLSPPAKGVRVVLIDGKGSF